MAVPHFKQGWVINENCFSNITNMPNRGVAVVIFFLPVSHLSLPGRLPVDRLLFNKT